MYLHDHSNAHRTARTYIDQKAEQETLAQLLRKMHISPSTISPTV